MRGTVWPYAVIGAGPWASHKVEDLKAVSGGGMADKTGANQSGDLSAAQRKPKSGRMSKSQVLDGAEAIRGRS